MNKHTNKHTKDQHTKDQHTKAASKASTKAKTKTSDHDDQNDQPVSREMGRLNFSDQIKSELDAETPQGHTDQRVQQNLDDDADWNMQSGSRNYSTRGQNEDYDYDEDDQEIENSFVARGLEQAEEDRDYDDDSETPKSVKSRTHEDYAGAEFNSERSANSRSGRLASTETEPQKK